MDVAEGGVSPCMWVFSLFPHCESSFAHKEHKTDIWELGAQVLGVVSSLFFSYLQKGRGGINTKTRCLKKAQARDGESLRGGTIAKSKQR